MLLAVSFMSSVQTYMTAMQGAILAPWAVATHNDAWRQAIGRVVAALRKRGGAAMQCAVRLLALADSDQAFARACSMAAADNNSVIAPSAAIAYAAAHQWQPLGQWALLVASAPSTPAACTAEGTARTVQLHTCLPA